MRVSYSLLAMILLAGCSSHPAPATSPRPVATRTTAAPPDSARRTSAAASTVPRRSPADSALVQAGDVARLASEVFGDSLLLAAAPASLSATRPTWDMDIRSYEAQERVAFYVSAFTGRSKERIAERLERGTRYEAMIREKMRAGGLPEDMYYLALIESGYDPHAYSRAAAVGMWQFMTPTARWMGMRVDRWVDERRDPVRSTAGAVRFIRVLRDQFGSLYLAAAAYNGGPGRVARGLARYAEDLENAQGDDAFFVLASKDYLRDETREYVPQLIAAALIAKDPVRYGMELKRREPFAYDSVRVPGSTPLAAVARAARARIAEITDLNPHLLRGMTPPRESFLIRVPVGAAAGFDSAFSTLPPEALVATRTVETKKGDTTDRLAREAGISVSLLRSFNPSLRRLKSGRLAPGQRVVVPTPQVAAVALRLPESEVEQPAASARTAAPRVHLVKRGESLGSIARKHGLTTARLMKVNGLRKPVIVPGQSLQLTAGSPTGKVSQTTSREPGGEAASSDESAAVAPPARLRSAAASAARAKAVRSGAVKRTAKSASASKSARRGRAAKARVAAKADSLSTKKRTGAGSNAGARTKEKVVKQPARAAR